MLSTVRSIPVEGRVCFVSFLLHLLGWVLLSRIFSRRFETYRRTTEDQRRAWDVRVGSTCHAIIATTGSLFVVLYDKESWNSPNPLLGQSQISNCVMLFTVGYFLADAILMFVYLRGCDDMLSLLFHHVITCNVMLFSWYFGAFQPLILSRNTTECSTIFLNTRWMLKLSEMKHTRLYFANGILFTFTFFLFRIVTIPYIYVWIYFYRETYLSMGFVMLMPATAVVLDAMNLFWFQRVMRGLFQYLKNDWHKIKSS